MRNAVRRLLLLAVLAGGCRGSEEPAPPAPPAPTAPAARSAPSAPADAAPAPAAAPVTTPAPAVAVNDAERTALLARVALVGASATAGFGAIIDDGAGGSALTTLSHVFAAAVNRRPRAIVSNGGHLMFFTAPMDVGASLVANARSTGPTLVVAVDFLFWFGYGSRGADGRPIDDEMDRLDMLESGLAFLDAFECPLVVGDLPDMSPAIGLMLSAAQVPAPDTLEILNARLHDWAAERPHVIVLPFARLVDAMRTNEPFVVGDRSWPAGSERMLVQPDRLHPTPRGLVAVMQMVAHALLERFPQLRASDFELDPDLVIRRVQEMIGS